MNIQKSAYLTLKELFHSIPVFPSVLLLDEETKYFISTVYRLEDLSSNDIDLIDTLSNRRKAIKRDVLVPFQCICIIRPTQENIDNIILELQEPHFSKYYIYFTNTILTETIDQIAANDRYHLVYELQEVYIDFSALGSNLFSLNLPDINSFRINCKDPQRDKIVDGLFATICTMKVNPIIRYDKSSEYAKEVATRLKSKVEAFKNSFENPKIRQTVFLILDRRSDMATPLLHPYTYYAAIHEVFGIDNNKVNLTEKNIEIIDELNDHDTEKVGTMDLGDAKHFIENRIDVWNSENGTEKAKTRKHIIGENYIKTHYNIMEDLKKANALSRERCNLINLEQSIVTGIKEKEHANNIIRFIQNPNTSPIDSLRLVLCFALNYTSAQSNLTKILAALQKEASWENGELNYASKLIQITGGERPPTSIISSLIKSISMSDAEGVGLNIQYKPLFEKILIDLKEKKLDKVKYPFVDSSPSDTYNNIVFFIGGATYLEHSIAASLSYHGEGAGFHFAVGGTTVHNAQSFLNHEVRTL